MSSEKPRMSDAEFNKLIRDGQISRIQRRLNRTLSPHELKAAHNILDEKKEEAERIRTLTDDQRKAEDLSMQIQNDFQEAQTLGNAAPSSELPNLDRTERMDPKKTKRNRFWRAIFGD